MVLNSVPMNVMRLCPHAEHTNGQTLLLGANSDYGKLLNQPARFKRAGPMNKAAAILIVIFFIVPLFPAASGEARSTSLAWTSDRTINAAEELPGDTSLEVAAGVNITFVSPAELPEDPLNNTPSLTVEGQFTINGTAQKRVTFSGGSDVYARFHNPAYVYIYGNQSESNFSISNATFRDLRLYLEKTAGEFRDCCFERCEINDWMGLVNFQNCSFLTSCLGNWYASHDMLIENCSFDGGPAGHGVPEWSTSTNGAAFSARGLTKVLNCSFTGYLEAISLEGAAIGSRLFGCSVTSCDYGISVAFEMPGTLMDRVNIENCSLSDIRIVAISTTGNVLIANCSINGSGNGLELYTSYRVVGGHFSPYTDPQHWTIGNNRIYGNAGYGIYVVGKAEDLELAGNIFDNGPGTENGLGRVFVERRLSVTVLDQLQAYMFDVSLNATNPFGTRVGSRLPGRVDGLETRFDDYMIDNAGARIDYTPVTFVADKDNVTSTPVKVTATTLNITLVIPWLTDLTPVNVSIEPARFYTGQRVNITYLFRNVGLRNIHRSSVKPIAPL